MRNVIVHFMNGNRSASRRRIRHSALRASETKALAAIRIDAHCAGGAGVSSAAGAFHGELPVRVVGFVAGCEGRVSG
jgi:hypothetical protein